MKEFNLDRALAGDPVITRMGIAVSQFVLFNLTKSSFPLHGVFEDGVNCWTIHGRYGIDGDHDFDLFMAPVKKQEWINIYNHGFGNYQTGACVYTSQELAIRSKDLYNNYVTSVLVKEWEE